MNVQGYLLGSGRAAKALEKSLQMLQVMHPELKIQPVRQLKRGEKLPNTSESKDLSILIIANPHGLHAKTIIEADTLGFKLIVVEKPAAVSLAEIESLKKIQTPVAVCHVYRQMWGPQKLKRMIVSNEFGKIITIEGRYWQSSTAAQSLKSAPSGSWKNDINLSGPVDTLLDVGSHWADLAIFLEGNQPEKSSIWFSYVNAEAEHRDSHVHLKMDFNSGLRALASISKNVHGAPNHFEINILGSKKSATWKFLEADEINIGEGNQRRVMIREDSDMGSEQAPFHGTGWLEGYTEILHQAIRHLRGEKYIPYPNLSENLNLLSTLLKAERES